MTKPRGRPRSFDPDQALDGAISLFWRQGFAATSLDDLAKAMGLNRPSIYNAFGDKEAVYRQALAHYTAKLDQGLAATLMAEDNLQAGLQGFFAAALAVYFSTRPAQGCMMICTAPVEAMAHPDVQADLRKLITRVDTALEQRLKHAQAVGTLSSDEDCRICAKLIQALLHSVALRARAGESKQSLQRFIAGSLDRIVPNQT